MKKPVLLNGEFYHIYNRGVLGVKTFRNVRDYIRFQECLKEFNTPENIDIQLIRSMKKNHLNQNSPPPTNHQQLVKILAYCIMPNHFHLLLQQIRDHGIPLFMQKIGTGYTMYFNKKYDSRGHIFQGRYQAVHITDANHLLHTSLYIHLNPIKKRDDLVIKMDLTEDQLKKAVYYPWSSFSEYYGDPANEIPAEIRYTRPNIHRNILLSFLPEDRPENPYRAFLQEMVLKKEVINIK